MERLKKKGEINNIVGGDGLYIVIINSLFSKVWFDLVFINDYYGVFYGSSKDKYRLEDLGKMCEKDISFRLSYFLFIL